MFDPIWTSPSVLRLLDLALEEDLGRGDITTTSVIGGAASADADLVAREAVVVAGLPLAAAVFHRVDPTLHVQCVVKDGEAVGAGTRLATVTGSARAILAAERTALNFAQRLSGIATLTRAYVDAARGSSLKVADTRKTTPGARALEKYAVRTGGGSNHRFDLGSGVLIKDNHIAVAGSVAEAVRRARAVAPHPLKIEVEVDTLAQLDEAITAAADMILLDNFSDEQIAEAVARVAGLVPRPLLEVSGGVTLARIPALARTGVDLVSVGALTHSARAVDLALDVRVADAR